MKCSLGIFNFLEEISSFFPVPNPIDLNSLRIIPRFRHKKAFFSDQCKEIEENNRIGKTRDLFQKIRDIKGIFHAKMGSIKDRNGKDLTEAEGIKTRWQEYTEELYKKRSSRPR